jgi:uncharacterized protein
MPALIDLWLRRWWRPSPAREAFAGLQAVTVVTGGSEGIGRALALEFAKLGNPVMLVARRAEPLAVAARAIEAAGGKAFAVVADLSTPAGFTSIDDALVARRAFCDVLINNAAMGLSGPFVEHAPNDVARLVDLNVGQLTALMHHHLPGMLARGRGGIVNVASLGGYMPGPHQAAYYASKAYVLSLTEAVAAECPGKGVRICAVAPGPVATAFHERMGANRAYYAAFAGWTSAASVATQTLRGYRWGRTVIVPGLPWRALAIMVRILPHPILVPIVSWLLQRRG